MTMQQTPTALTAKVSASIHAARASFHRFKRWEPLVFFVAGFAFDAFLLHRIDDPLMLVHQGIYLALSAGLIIWEIAAEAGRASVPRWAKKIWQFRVGILHFMLGTLLNVYTIFYFKSGTVLGSFLFLLLLAVLLYLNEVRPSGIPTLSLRSALIALCLTSYLNILVPIAVGTIGSWVFFLAMACAGVVQWGFSRLVAPFLERERVQKEILGPFAAVAVLIASLYLLKILPPVPLSLKHIGIYREVTRVEGGYRLAYRQTWWRFWESGEQVFEAQPGDNIYGFVQVFSPARFREQIYMRWQYRHPADGWTEGDAIPLSVVGGRDEGFRGYTMKSNYEPGQWRIRVETRDGREVGRIGFEIVDASQYRSIDKPLVYETR